MVQMARLLKVKDVEKKNYHVLFHKENGEMLIGSFTDKGKAFEMREGLARDILIFFIKYAWDNGLEIERA